MRIRWMGHACFRIETDNGVIVTDPAPEETGYRVPVMGADLVTISHQHWDHADKTRLMGNPVVMDKAGQFTYGDITVEGLPSYHDKSKGRDRGSNIIFRIETGGISIAHLGDLGEEPDPKVLSRLTGLDILLVPVGGVYTIDAKEAFSLIQKIEPRVVIPMHFKTPHLSFDLDPVEKFLINFKQAEKLPELVYSKEETPDLRVVVLDYTVS